MEIDDEFVLPLAARRMIVPPGSVETVVPMSSNPAAVDGVEPVMETPLGAPLAEI
jgi:hypothetical protein